MFQYTFLLMALHSLLSAQAPTPVTLGRIAIFGVVIILGCVIAGFLLFLGLRQGRRPVDKQ